MNLNPFSSGFYQNPADNAMNIMGQIPDTIKPYYSPYIDSGRNALSTIEQQYQQLLKDPASLMALIGGNFTQSPGYKFQYDQGMNASDSAAAAGGMAGTAQHQFNSGKIASNLANQDYYNFLDRGMHLYDRGLQGYEGINKMGYDASNELANSLANTQMNQANMSYLGQSNQNQANADMFSGILRGVTGLIKANPWNMFG